MFFLKLKKEGFVIRESSSYLSEFFLSVIWPQYASTLKKPRTRSDYFSYACNICDYLECDFLSITLEGAKGYFNKLCRDKKLSVKSMNTRLYSLHSISSFIYKNKDFFDTPNYIDVFQFVSVSSYDTHLRAEDVPDKKTIDRLLTACEKDDTMFLILSLVIRCSLTASQICHLTPSMIATDASGRCFITFRSYNRERHVRVPNDVMKLVCDYIEINGIKDHLFYNQKGRPLQIRTLQDMMSNLSVAAGLKKPVTLQDLRNASITLMLHGGATPSSVAYHAGVSERWMYRYDSVLEDIDDSPCEYMHLEIKNKNK